jgi:serine/threonine protein kinase
MCPHTTIYVSSYYCMCPHTIVCVLILLYMCPHTIVYVSSYYYICVLTDVWSVGILIYECMVGASPYAAKGMRTLTYADVC